MKFFSLLLFTLFPMAGYAQSPPYGAEGKHLFGTNLVVRWKAEKKPWPDKLWIYRMKQTQFSSAVISNLMVLGCFSDKDIDHVYSNTNGTTYLHNGNMLFIGNEGGEIEYSAASHAYSATNLARNVPTTNQLFQLMTNFLPKLGINFSDVAKDKKGKLHMGFNEPMNLYFSNNVVITNIDWRSAGVKRMLDGIEFWYASGRCGVTYGPHSQVIGIDYSWPDVERDKLCTAATPEKITQWISSGRAIVRQILSPFQTDQEIERVNNINWSSVKSVTITHAKAAYWSDFFSEERANKSVSSNYVTPFAVLWGTVDTGTSKIDVQLWCQLIQE